MDQSCVPEIQEVVGRQEGAGNGNRMEPEVTLNINQDESEPSPSIFRSGRLACVAPSSRGSTGGNVIVIAVGPYHSTQSPPPLITQDKKRAIVQFLAGFLDTAAFLGWALDNDARARGCYDPEDSLTVMEAEELAEMHLLDGCLVLLAVFLLSVREDQRPAELAGTTELGKELTTLSKGISLHMKQTKLDLLLIGNQIPFFVLEHLHDELKRTIFFRENNRTILELALSCFDDIRPSLCPALTLTTPTVVHHLLHLFHWSRVPPGRHAVNNGSPASPPLLGEPESNLPCATWFQESLIGLRSHAAARGTLHIDFRRSMLGARGVLRVPVLDIHDYSALVFHNLIAFEQNHLRCGFSATTYCMCMARLLQSEADAKLLRRSRILAHTHKTDEEIVGLFKRLAEEYRHASYSRDLLDLSKEVEAHHGSTAARFVKSIVLQCFPKQTVTFFVILGALISIATLANTIFAIIRFYHPVKH